MERNLYNGMLASVQKRLSRGVSMSANYTLSHCIGYYQGFNSKPEETATNPYNPLGDRGNCDSDRRQYRQPDRCGAGTEIFQ